MFSIKPKTLHYWYKEELSGYKQDIAAGKWGDKKIYEVDSGSGEVVSEKEVPVAKAENFGSHMTIDEKQIGKKMYTVMTNSQTGKIALLARTMKPEELKQVINNYLPDVTTVVQSISADMSPSYRKFCKEMFPGVQLVVDKFHVIKHLMEALQQVRKQLKTQCINADTTLVVSNKPNDPNQQKIWTEIELLERSRYILCKMQAEWELDEKEIIEHLFSRYPVLQTAYLLTQKLRTWYSNKNVKKHYNLVEIALYNWCDEVSQTKIPAFRAVRKMIEKHQDDIINYFKEGQTNAKAENMNSRIQRFLANNFGIKDRDFFFYRLAGYFT
jgi:transposase